ncbi:MAG TPA: PKD domain-containing protein [Planctomycetaceae bacterium]|nr:PKD domain-containing protein [Planctomycetaceae bacterium]
MHVSPLQQLLRHLSRLPMRRDTSAKRSRRATLGRPLDRLEDRLMLTAISPVEMRRAYGIDQIKLGAAGLAGNGAGQTIGIIEIGTDASLVSDLKYFDQQLFGSGPDGAQLLDTFGNYTGPVSGSTRPWFDSISDPNFPPSVGTAKQDLEAALDVEWAHVVAPMANIVVVQTASNQSGAAYVSAQTQLGVSTVASSYYLFPNLNPANYSQPNVAFVGITGDTGTSINSQQVGFTLNNFPASSPAIIAVGGTTLSLNTDGSYRSETGWGFASPNRFLTSGQAYIAPGYWNAVSGGFSGTYYTSPGPSGTTSTVWSTTVASTDVLGKNDSGLELSTTWIPSLTNADNAEYEISVNGDPVDTVTVNQQLAPNGTTGTLNARSATFQELCALTKVAVGDTITITIPAQNADGSVVIDAIGLAPDDASGGGLSNNPAPTFQNALVIHDGNAIISANGTRTNPDVAFDGDYINSPVEIYNQGAVQLAAGTSLGAPAWAALLAIADQGLAMAGQPAMSTAAALAGLYSLPSYDFHDETSGYNGYSAGPGYDLVTGLGSPVANQLIPDLDNTVSPVSGPLTCEAPEGQGPVSLQVVQVGSNIEILDATHNYAVVAAAPLAVTTGIDIVGAGNTTNNLTLNFGPFSPSDPFYQPNLSYPTGIPVTFDGGSLGGGSGTLILEGGSFNSETDASTGPHSGTVTLDGTPITYTNLAPIIDTTTAATLTINDPEAGDAVTVQNDPNSPENGFATSQISGSGFEKIDLADKTNVVFNNMSSVTDTFDLVNPLVDNAIFTIIQSTPQFHVSAPASASVNENASLVFSSATANGISVTDTGAGTNVQQLTLVAAHGTLTLGSISGLTFTFGSDGSASITVQGTLANLNAALNGLKFTPSTGYSGAAPVSVTYEDLGIAQTTSATTPVSVVVPASKLTVKIEAPEEALRGKAVPIRILASDTNSAANAASFRFSISFGDGSPIKSVTSKSPLSLSHVFEHAGIYTVAVIATDEYGHTSIAARVIIRILALPLGTGLSNDQSSQSFSGRVGPDAVAIAANATIDPDDQALQWAGLSAAIDILND